ncbi:MAG: MBL fold metallo-hydrolase [Solobacterium sp.]|nr:MBL fold metallo-hydrolase [Solobacterium sp.]
MAIREPLIHEIAPKTWMINEFGSNNMYVIEGSERALVVDAGTAYCDFRKIIESLTDKPYDVAITHAHPDHIGMMHQFERVYVNKLELGSIPDPDAPTDKMASGFGSQDITGYPTEPCKKYSELVRDGQASEAFQNLAGYTSDMHGFEMVDRFFADEPPVWECTPEMINRGTLDTELVFIDEGYEFDLGDRKVKTMFLPGHTRGHLLFIDPKNRIAFTGDCVNGNNGSSFHAASTHIRYLEKFIAEYGKSYDRIFNGHITYSRRLNFRSESINVVKNLANAYRALMRGEAEIIEQAFHLNPNGPKRRLVVYGSGTDEDPRVTPQVPPMLWEDGEEHLIP